MKPDNLQRPARCQIRRCKSKDEDLRLFQALRRLSGRLFLLPGVSESEEICYGSSSFYIRIRDRGTSRQDLRPDLRRDPRRDPGAGSKRPRCLRVHGHDRRRERHGRDHDRVLRRHSEGRAPDRARDRLRPRQVRL